MLIVVGGWLWAWSIPLKSIRRTASFLTVVSGAFVGAGLIFSPQPASAARLLLVLGFLIMVTRGRWWLMGISQNEAALDRHLRELTKRVTDAHAGWMRSYGGGDEPATAAARDKAHAACAAAVEELDKLSGPSQEWRETIGLLRRYFVALQRAATRSTVGPGKHEPSYQPDSLPALNRQAMAAWEAAVRRAQG